MASLGPKRWIGAFSAIWLIASLCLGSTNSSVSDILAIRSTTTTTLGKPTSTTTTLIHTITYPPSLTRTVYYTDWELSNPFVEPANPSAGDMVSFGVTIRVVSTNIAFPQTVRIEILGPGIFGSVSATLPGPGQVSIRTPANWRVNEGEYTVTLVADAPPPYQYNDPNRANNQVSISFRVQEFDFRLEAVAPAEGLEAISDHPDASRRIAICTINVVLVSGAPKPVFLNATLTPTPLHLPKFTFTPTSGMPTFSSILQINATEVWSGTFTITVYGNGGGKTHSTTIPLRVRGYSRMDLGSVRSPVFLGEVVHVVGFMTPALDAGDPPIIIRYTRPNGTYFERTVPPNHEYVDDYITPDAVGIWSFQASWPGNDRKLGCTSNISTFEVRMPAPPTIERGRVIPDVAVYAVSGAAIIGVAYLLWRKFHYA